MKKDDFLVVITTASVLSFVFCNFFILFKRSLFDGFTFDSSNFLLPILYISSDLIQEIYGYKKSRLVARITIAGQLIFAILCFSSLKFFNIMWLDDAGNEIIKQNILGSIASTITIASIIAYYVGDFVNDVLFKKLNNNKDSLIDYGKRAFTSSLAQKIVDAIIFNLILISLPNSEFTFKFILIPILLEILFEILFLPVSHKFVMRIKHNLK